MVVNGMTHVLGSDKDGHRTRHRVDAKTADALSVPVSLAVTDGKLGVKVPAAPSRHGARRGLALPGLEVGAGDDRRGENNGRTVTYHNVVRRWLKLGEWTGKAESWNVPLADFVGRDDIDHAAVLVQRGPATSPSLMLGAAMTALK